MDPDRRTSLIGGLFFLFTFIHIAVVALWEPVLDHANYVIGAGDDGRIYLGAFIAVLFIIANAATAIVFYRVLKRQSQTLSLGYVGVRIFESVMIAIGLASVLALVTLRQDVGGAGAAHPASLVIAGRSLVAIHDATFLLGPQFCAALGNGILLGYLMFRSGLVPKRMAMIGLIGGPLAFLSGSLVIFDVLELGKGAQAILTFPEAIWELSLSLWLIFKGFNKSSPVLAGSAKTTR